MYNTSEHLQGLSEEEVKEREEQGLQNIYQPRPTRTYKRIILENVFGFFNLLLMSSITLLIVLHGDRGVLFSTVLLCINIALGLIQEIRAKYNLDKLSLLVPRLVTVRRGGKNIQILTHDVVKDDILVLQSGNAIIADGPLLQSGSLEVDESSLTGESNYVVKQSGEMLYSGSYCVAGSGMMKAEKIGEESSLNKLEQKAHAYKLVRTPLENRLAKILRLIIIAIAVFGPLTVVAGITVNLSLSASIENMVNVLFSLVPQGLITSVAVLFALGAIRISKSQAIVQRMNAVESMGHVKILCTDKTGTLTKNELKVYGIIPLEGTAEKVQQQLSLFIFNISSPNQTITALTEAVAPSEQTPQIRAEVPFKSENKWSGITFSSLGTFILGSPEQILTDTSSLEKAMEFSKDGYRVLVFGQSDEKLDPKKASLPGEIKPLALLVFSDEVRADVSATLKSFSDLDIQVKIISGDNEETVQAIAQQAGLKEKATLTQEELEKMKSHHFDKAVRKTTLFARINPDMKRKIVQSLMQQGLYTAMVGDGVNDVLALKKAKVSIAMNSGAQIAKDVSDIVLLDNSFCTLPKAIEEGRDIIQRIYAIAKIFFIKVIYFLVLFLLVGFSNLPFPINLRQTTLLGFLITGIPILLITFKFLQPEKKESSSKDFIEYTMFAGIVGGMAMTYLTVVTVAFLHQDIELSRTLVTVFASLYSSVILGNILGISLFDWQSIRRNITVAIIILILTIDSIFLPVFYFPKVFDLVHLQIYHWLLLIVLTVTCSYILNFYKKKISFHKIWGGFIND